MRAAAIGIGSNSLRLLVADIDPKSAQLCRVLRDRKGLRVFAALDENGNISQEMIEEACQSVQQFVEKAKACGAKQCHLFATSAVRDAANGKVFSNRIESITGLPLDICSGTAEAKLSFLGATGGEHSGLIDIGGGSTEIVIGQADTISFSCSFQMGAVRLQRQCSIATVHQAHQVVALAASTLLPQRQAILSQEIESWIGVGGTFTTTSALVQNIPWTSKKHIHGHVLTQADVCWCMEWLAPMPMEKRTRLNGLHPQRADIVVHGIAILLACMQQLSISQIVVSEFGNLEGYLRNYYFVMHA